MSSRDEEPMGEYPVAGSIITFDLAFGLSVEDVAKAYGAPLGLLVIPRMFEIQNPTLNLYLAFSGLIIGTALLLLKPQNMGPLEYGQVVLRYYIQKGPLYKVQPDREYDVQHEDTILTAQDGGRDD
jgi:hypothetical protein